MDGRLRARPHPPQCAHWGTFPKGEGLAIDTYSGEKYNTLFY